MMMLFKSDFLRRGMLLMVAATPIWSFAQTRSYEYSVKGDGVEVRKVNVTAADLRRFIAVIFKSQFVVDDREVFELRLQDEGKIELLDPKSQEVRLVMDRKKVEALVQTAYDRRLIRRPVVASKKSSVILDLPACEVVLKECVDQEMADLRDQCFKFGGFVKEEPESLKYLGPRTNCCFAKPGEIRLASAVRCASKTVRCSTNAKLGTATYVFNFNEELEESCRTAPGSAVPLPTETGVSHGKSAEKPR